MSYFSYAETLKTPYREVFERAHLYASLKEMAVADFDDGMLNLYDVLYTAQEEGRPVEKIVGQDLEQFCQDYFQTRQLENFVKDLPNRTFSLFRSFLYLGLFFVIGDLLTSGKASSINLIPFLLGLLSALLIIPISKVLYRAYIVRKKLSITPFYIILLAIFVLLAFGPTVILSRLGIFDKLVFSVSPPIIIGLSLIYLVPYHLHLLYQNYQKFGSFKNLDKEVERLEQKKVEQGSYDRIIAKGLLKYHFKKYQKMRQKGLTSQAIFEKWSSSLEKREKFEDKAHWLIYLLIWLGALLPVYLTSPFSEFLIYATLQTVFLLFLGIKMTNYTKKARYKVGQFLNQIKPYRADLGTYLEEQLKSFGS